MLFQEGVEAQGNPLPAHCSLIGLGQSQETCLGGKSLSALARTWLRGKPVLARAAAYCPPAACISSSLAFLALCCTRHGAVRPRVALVAVGASLDRGSALDANFADLRGRAPRVRPSGALGTLGRSRGGRVTARFTGEAARSPALIFVHARIASDAAHRPTVWLERTQGAGDAVDAPVGRLVRSRPAKVAVGRPAVQLVLPDTRRARS